MNALQRVQIARKNLATYLNNERANLANRSVNDIGAVELLEHARKTIQMMEFLQVITKDEADTLCDTGIIDAMHTKTNITLPAITNGKFGSNYEFDFADSTDATLKKWWRARITAAGTKLLQEYNATKDVCRKHDILDVLAAGMEAGELTGSFTITERMQLALYIHKSRKELTGG